MGWVTCYREALCHPTYNDCDRDDDGGDDGDDDDEYDDGDYDDYDDDDARILTCSCEAIYLPTYTNHHVNAYQQVSFHRDADYQTK